MKTDFRNTFEITNEERRGLSAFCLQPHHDDAYDYDFKGLNSITHKKQDEKLKICILTQDIVGPVKNGGIGTAYTYAAELLASNGHDVTILYALNRHSIENPIEYWIDNYKKRGINFVPCPPAELKSERELSDDTTRRAYNAYEWLKTHEFDVVHASEWQGLAYFCLQAKKMNIAFRNTLFCIKASSPTLWNILGNERYLINRETLSKIVMERKSIELADIVISGSKYLLRWMLSHGYKLPEKRAYAQPNIMPISDKHKYNVNNNEPIDEIVFFGRLEARKGIEIFCESLNLLIESGDIQNTKLENIKVTFLGKFAKSFDAFEYIKRESVNWKFSWKIEDSFSQPEAIDYLSSPGLLAVMPSRVDNSPFGVYECLAYGIPFLASNVGGIPELIDHRDHKSVIFDFNPTDLKNLLLDTLVNGAIVPRPSFDFKDNQKQWVEFHQKVKNIVKDISVHFDTNSIKNSNRLVSVCLEHYDRPRHLNALLSSIYKQDYKNIEVIIVDNGSKKKRAIEKLKEIQKERIGLNCKIFWEEKGFPGSAKNKAAERSSGDYLFFLDVNNYLEPGTISSLVEISEKTNSDILTYFVKTFRSGIPSINNKDKEAKIITQVGDNLSYGFFDNGFGDESFFIKKDSFNWVGGFDERHNIGNVEQDFFSRCLLQGLTLELIPEPVLWRRVLKNKDEVYNENLFASKLRVAQTFSKSLPLALEPLLYYLASLHDNSKNMNEEINRLKRLSSDEHNNSFNMSNNNSLVQDDVYQLYKYILKLENNVNILLNSKTWRFMGPMREIGRLLKLFVHGKRISRTRLPERPKILDNINKLNLKK